MSVASSTSPAELLSEIPVSGPTSPRSSLDLLMSKLGLDQGAEPTCTLEDLEAAVNSRSFDSDTERDANSPAEAQVESEAVSVARFDEASSASTSTSADVPPAWLHELWAAANSNEYFLLWDLLCRIVKLVTGSKVEFDPKDKSAIPSLLPDPQPVVNREAMQSAQTAAALIQETLKCAEEVLRGLDEKDVQKLPECMFQFLLFVLMRTYEPDQSAQLRFSLVKMEAKCKRLHAPNDTTYINLSPTYSPGSPTRSDGYGGGRADLVCSIADPQDRVVANYVIELKSVRYLSPNSGRADVDEISVTALMELELGKRPGPADLLRNEQCGVTHVKHVVASALHQSCSYHSFDSIDGKAWPPADSPPVRHLAAVCVRHRLALSDSSCVGVDPYSAWGLRGMPDLERSIDAVVEASTSAANAVSSQKSAFSSASSSSVSSEESFRPIASWNQEYTRQSAETLRKFATDVQRLAAKLTTAATHFTTAATRLTATASKRSEQRTPTVVQPPAAAATYLNESPPSPTLAAAWAAVAESDPTGQERTPGDMIEHFKRLDELKIQHAKEEQRKFKLAEQAASSESK